MIPLVIVCGSKGSGKDTFAGFLTQQYGAESVAQADPMKRFAGALFGFEEEHLWGPCEIKEQPAPAYPVSMDSAIAHLYHLGFELGMTGLGQDVVGPFRTWYSSQMDLARQNSTLVPRDVLQTMGTEFGRRVWGEDVWSRQAIAVARKLLRGTYSYKRTTGLLTTNTRIVPMVCIPDGRFPNEILNVREIGGLAVLIRRERRQAAPATAVELERRNHKSESLLEQIPSHFYDAIVHNDGSLLNLETTVTRLIPDRLLEIHAGVTTSTIPPLPASKLRDLRVVTQMVVTA